MKKVWFDKYNRRTEPTRPPPVQQTQQHQRRQQGNAFENRPFRPYGQFPGPRFPYQPYQQKNAYNRPYQPYQSYQPYSPRPYNVNVNVPPPQPSVPYHQPLQITSGNANTGNRNEYAGRNDQPRQDNRRPPYQPNRPYPPRPQPAYHGDPEQPVEGFTEGGHDGGYTEGGYEEGGYYGEYNYDYGGDIYPDTKEAEQANHAAATGDAAAPTLDTSENTYHIDTFHARALTTAHACRMCKTSFSSNNKLHKHVRSTHPKTKGKAEEKEAKTLSSEPELKSKLIDVHHADIIESDATNIIDEPGCGFRNWHYMTVFFQFNTNPSVMESFTKPACLDTGCTMSLVDRDFLRKHLPDTVIQKTASKITVRGIGSRTHECQNYVRLSLYLPGSLNGKVVVAHLERDVHLVDNLRANLLIGMDIIGPERISMDIPSRKAIIGGCRNMLIDLDITP